MHRPEAPRGRTGGHTAWGALPPVGRRGQGRDRNGEGDPAAGGEFGRLDQSDGDGRCAYGGHEPSAVSLHVQGDAHCSGLRRRRRAARRRARARRTRDPRVRGCKGGNCRALLMGGRARAVGMRGQKVRGGARAGGHLRLPNRPGFVGTIAIPGAQADHGRSIPSDAERRRALRRRDRQRRHPERVASPAARRAARLWRRRRDERGAAAALRHLRGGRRMRARGHHRHAH
mmetsp:Transcript_57324/g.124549  ORF Transcript_57324/g.124549 Transcript_57324/m.124549 type:complete len:230 (+) Transcript_57324:750-1439(+)